jgi:ATP-dependent Clp protease ATP-binding subunit ClpC
MTELGYPFEVTDKAIEFICEKGYDVQFGARPLQRSIQKHIEDVLAEEILTGELQEGDSLIVDFDAEIKTIAKRKLNETTPVVEIVEDIQ